MTTIAASAASAAPAGLRAAAVAYPLLWLVGLSLSSGPALDASPGEIAAHYVTSGGAALTQSAIVHGLATVALVLVGAAVVRAARRVAPAAAGAASVALGLAVATSVAQLALGLVAAGRADDTATAATAFAALNRLDSVKMLALGVLVGAGVLVARRGGMARWLAPVGAVLVVVLAVAALGYVLLAPGLAVAAVIGLPLLLVWICGAGLALGRR